MCSIQQPCKAQICNRSLAIAVTIIATMAYYLHNVKQLLLFERVSYLMDNKFKCTLISVGF